MPVEEDAVYQVRYDRDVIIAHKQAMIEAMAKFIMHNSACPGSPRGCSYCATRQGECLNTIINHFDKAIE